jgi:hypothetical protein
MPQTRWIVSKRFDLIFIIGSVAASFGFFGLYWMLTHAFHVGEMKAAVLVTGLFSFGMDQPHIFQTLSRVTSAEKDEYDRIRFLMFASLAAWFLLAESCVYFGFTEEFELGFAIYGVYHIVRQNVGFIKAYKNVNKDFHPADNRMDSWCYYIVMFGCMISAGSQLDYLGDRPIIPHWGEVLALAVVVATAALNTIPVTRPRNEGRALNKPKLALMGGTFFTHFAAAFLVRNPAMFTMMDTAYHDVQYHGWMAHYQRRRHPSKARAVIAKWLALSLAYGVLAYVLLNSESAYTPYFEYGLYSVILWHYFIDARLWRFSKDKALAKLLLTPPDSAPSALHESGSSSAA